MGLGKTVGLYKDRNTVDQNHSGSSVITRVLGNNGELTLHDLDSFIQDDVFRYGNKLEDMLKKLRQALDEQLDEAEPDDSDLGEDELMFGGIPGMGDMDDFLGLEGIGAIPKRLLRDRNKNKALVAQKEQEEPELEYKPPPPFIPLHREDIPFQIGILRAFYTSKFDALEPVHPTLAAGQDTSEPPNMVVPPSPDQELPDQEWDPSMTQLGAFGQVIVRGAGSAAAKKASEERKERKAKKDKKRALE